MSEELEFVELETIFLELESGEKLECAILDELTLEGKHYIAVSPVDGDDIRGDIYLFRCTELEDDLDISKIEDKDEFDRVLAAFDAKQAEEEAADSEEADTVTLTLENGETQECAVVDTLEIDGVKYMAASPVEGDDVSGEIYFFRYTEDGDELNLEAVEYGAEYDMLVKAFSGTEDDTEYDDYETIMVPLENGEDLECAILDQIELDGKSYIAVAPIVDDAIGDETYVYGYREIGDEIELTYIDDEAELSRVADAFYAGDED